MADKIVLEIARYAPEKDEKPSFQSFEVPFRSRVTMGCNNLFDTQPPRNGKAIPSYGFDIATYSQWSLGRFIYLKIGKDF